MRAVLSKIVAGSMIAGAALMVSACGGETANNTATTEVTNTDNAVVDAGVTNVDAAPADNAVVDNGAVAANASNAM